MTVTCPECRSIFRIDPAKVPASGVRARCSVCGGVIAIRGGTLSVMVTPASAGVVQAAFATPTEGSRAVAAPPSFAPTSPAPTSPATTSPATTSPAAVMSRSTSPRDQTSIPQPALRSPPSVASHSVPQSTPTSRGDVLPPVAPPPSTSAPASVDLETPRRPINPFLKADPGQRARRLARALVSDLVAYHPQKRDEGIQNGTLRQLFREEIKKSYEEYVEQVGRELAEASPHFQEALNDILGGGRKLF